VLRKWNSLQEIRSLLLFFIGLRFPIIIICLESTKQILKGYHCNSIKKKKLTIILVWMSHLNARNNIWKFLLLCKRQSIIINWSCSSPSLFCLNEMIMLSWFQVLFIDCCIWTSTNAWMLDFLMFKYLIVINIPNPRSFFWKVLTYLWTQSPLKAQFYITKARKMSSSETCLSNNACKHSYVLTVFYNNNKSNYAVEEINNLPVKTVGMRLRSMTSCLSCWIL